MKKLGMIAVVLLVGVGFAYASTLSVPWFVDKKDSPGLGLPPQEVGIEAIIYLHNNKTEEITCAIEYFTQDGESLGPAAPNNTFVIAAQATTAFRPVVSDLNSTDNPRGQEALSGNIIPDKPMDTSLVGGDKSNGSAVIAWVGVGTDVQGILLQSQKVIQNTVQLLSTWGTLLPPGA